MNTEINTKEYDLLMEGYVDYQINGKDIDKIINELPNKKYIIHTRLLKFKDGTSKLFVLYKSSERGMS